ncbi:MAG: hydrogenase [Negativicutes bacterium]|nr:hydrogenase [Negativicutes bacterium]
MNVLVIVLFLSAFLLTRVTILRTAVIVLLLQSLAVAAACVVLGLETSQFHMYLAALLTIIIKAGYIPAALFKIVGRLRREREQNPILSPNYTSLTAALAIVLAYGLIDQALPGVVTRNALAAAIALLLIGLLIIMVRRQAVMQIVGLITMENGIYLLGLSVVKGLPLVIEFGVFLDILVAAVVLVILTYRLKISFLSTDTTQLRKLKG